MTRVEMALETPKQISQDKGKEGWGEGEVIWPTRRLFWVQLGPFLRPAVTLDWGSVRLFICWVTCGQVPSDLFEFRPICPIAVLCPGQLGRSARESAGLCGWAALGLESSRSCSWSVPARNALLGWAGWGYHSMAETWMSERFTARVWSPGWETGGGDTKVPCRKGHYPGTFWTEAVQFATWKKTFTKLYSCCVGALKIFGK